MILEVTYDELIRVDGSDWSGLVADLAGPVTIGAVLGTPFGPQAAAGMAGLGAAWGLYVHLTEA